MSFTSIPVLDLSLARGERTKPQFLRDLRHALIEVGFMYIKNVGVSDELFESVAEEGKAFFDIPMEEKLKIEMKNEKSFLGYSRLSAEITAGKTDHREQIDLSTEHPPLAPSAPRHHNLLAPNQWPSAESLPRFRPVYTEYISRMSAVSMEFTSLIAEAVGLPARAFDRFFDVDQQHKLKVVKYPEVSSQDNEIEGNQNGNQNGSQNGNRQINNNSNDIPNDDNLRAQGVGPHKDSMLSSYLLQATPHRGLQVQNLSGQWVDCPPIPGTLVVAIGQGMEALTRGVCVSTTHRVLSPRRGEGPRFSVPFFQGVSLDARFDELDGEGIGITIPDEAREQRRRVVERNNGSGGGGGRLDDVEFTFRRGGAGSAETLGEATLRNRVKSHPDVGERWYPDILADIKREQAGEGSRAELGTAY